MAAEKGKSKMKSAGKVPKYGGSYSSERYLGDKLKSVYINQDIKKMANPASDEKIVEILMKDQQYYLAKFIKKNLK